MSWRYFLLKRRLRSLQTVMVGNDTSFADFMLTVVTTGFSKYFMKPKVVCQTTTEKHKPFIKNHNVNDGDTNFPNVFLIFFGLRAFFIKCRKLGLGVDCWVCLTTVDSWLRETKLWLDGTSIGIGEVWVWRVLLFFSLTISVSFCKKKENAIPTILAISGWKNNGLEMSLPFR